MSADPPFLLFTPFSREREVVRSVRYRWRCDQRGDEPFVILQYTLAGRGRIELGGVVRDVGPGQAFIVLVPEEGEYRFPPGAREPWEFCWLNLYGAFAVHLWRALRDRFGPVVDLPIRSPAATALLRIVARRGERDLFEESAAAYSLWLACWRELAVPRRVRRGAEEAVEEARAFCDTHFREPATVKELAARAGMSREHFTRIFQRLHGVPPAAYLLGRRAEAAAELLRETRLPLSEVTLRAGFRSVHHLIKTFRRLHRCTPSRYRERHAHGGRTQPVPPSRARPGRSAGRRAAFP